VHNSSVYRFIELSLKLQTGVTPAIEPADPEAVCPATHEADPQGFSARLVSVAFAPVTAGFS